LELEKDFQLHKKRKNQKYNAGNKGVDAVSEIKGGVGGETLMAAATSHNSAAENTDLLALANDTQRSFIKTATLSPARPNGDPINNCDGEMKESDDRKILKKRILQLEMDLQRYKARIDEQKKALGPNDLPQIPWEGSALNSFLSCSTHPTHLFPGTSFICKSKMFPVMCLRKFV